MKEEEKATNKQLRIACVQRIKKPLDLRNQIDRKAAKNKNFQYFISFMKFFNSQKSTTAFSRLRHAVSFTNHKPQHICAAAAAAAKLDCVHLQT